MTGLSFLSATGFPGSSGPLIAATKPIAARVWPQMVFDIDGSHEVEHLKEADCAKLHAVNTSFWPTAQ